MDAVKYRKVVVVWLAVALLSLMVLTACDGVLEVGERTTPTTDAAATAVSTLATENAHQTKELLSRYSWTT